MKVLAQRPGVAVAVPPFIERRFPLLLRFVKFSLVGGSGAFVNFSALFLLHGMLRLPILVAAPLAVEMAIVNNFLWNNFWTFSQRSLAAGRFLKFNLTCLGGLIIAVGAVYVLVEGLGWHYLLANLVGAALASAWNFSLSVAWAWGTAVST